MDLKSREDNVTVILRLLGDGTSDQYKKCVELKGRHSVHFRRSSNFKAEELEGFRKKDKIVHSPLRESENCSPSHKFRSNSTPTSSKKTTENTRTFAYDYVVSEKEGNSAVCEQLNVELGKHNCIISVGRSETLTGDDGVILTLLNKVFELGFELKIGCCALVSGKVMNFIEGMRPVASEAEAAAVLKGLDYFNVKKPKDPIVVTTFMLKTEEDTVFTQLVDVSMLNKSVQTLGKVLTNTDYSGETPVHINEKLVQILYKSLGLGAEVNVIGNITPTEPHTQGVKNVLDYLDVIHRDKHKKKTTYTNILLIQIETLNKKLQTAAKNNENYRKQLAATSEEKGGLEEENGKLNSIMNQMSFKHNKSEETQLRTEIKSLKELNMIKADEVVELQQKFNDCKTRAINAEVNLDKARAESATALSSLKRELELNEPLKFPQRTASSPKCTQTEPLNLTSTSYIEVEPTFVDQSRKVFPGDRQTMSDMQYYDLLKSAWGVTNAVQKRMMSHITELKRIYKIKELTQKGRLEALQLIHIEALDLLQATQREASSLQNKANEAEQQNESRKKETHDKIGQLQQNASSAVNDIKRKAKNKINSYKAQLGEANKQVEALQPLREKYQTLKTQFETQKSHLRSEFNVEKEQLMTDFEEQIKKLREENAKLVELSTNNHSKRLKK